MCYKLKLHDRMNPIRSPNPHYFHRYTHIYPVYVTRYIFDISSHHLDKSHTLLDILGKDGWMDESWTRWFWSNLRPYFVSLFFSCHSHNQHGLMKSEWGRKKERKKYREKLVSLHISLTTPFHMGDKQKEPWRQGKGENKWIWDRITTQPYHESTPNQTNSHPKVTP